MEWKTFFTKAFYNNPKLTLDVLNKLLDKNQLKCLACKNGDFIYLEACENNTTKEILSAIICNFKKYKDYNNKKFIYNNTTQISLCALQDEHTTFFKFLEGNKEIKWDTNKGKFVFSEDISLEF